MKWLVYLLLVTLPVFYGEEVTLCFHFQGTSDALHLFVRELLSDNKQEDIPMVRGFGVQSRCYSKLIGHNVSSFIAKCNSLPLFQSSAFSHWYGT